MKEVEFIVMTFGLIVKIASADNYISSAMVEKLGLTQNVQRVDSSVKVADGRYIKIDGKINLMIRFKNRDGEYVMARLDLYLLEGLSLSIVIGIRSILDHFRPIFIDMLLQDHSYNNLHQGYSKREQHRGGHHQKHPKYSMPPKNLQQTLTTNESIEIRG